MLFWVQCFCFAAMGDEGLAFMKQKIPNAAMMPPAEVSAWVDDALQIDAVRVELVTHTMLHAGAKSVSHLEKLLEKYDWLLGHVASDARAKMQLVSAACSYWRDSLQMQTLLLRKLIAHGLIDAPAVLAHSFSPAGRPALIDGSGWSLVHAVVGWIVGQERDSADALRSAERRHEDLARDGRDDQAVLSAEERANEVRQKHEHVRREKKAAFANLFAGACAVLSEEAADGGVASVVLSAAEGAASELADPDSYKVSLE